MPGYFIKTNAKLHENGARQYPPDTADRMRHYASLGFDSFEELAGYRAGGTALADDVWVWVRKEKPDARNFDLG
jgi:hypothetical protein